MFDESGFGTGVYVIGRWAHAKDNVALALAQLLAEGEGFVQQGEIQAYAEGADIPVEQLEKAVRTLRDNSPIPGLAVANREEYQLTIVQQMVKEMGNEIGQQYIDI